MHIVLDTSTIYKDFHLRGPYFRVLTSANRAGLSVSVPEVVFDEFTNHHKEDLQENWNQINKAAGQFRQLLGDSNAVPIAKPDLAKIHADYCNRLKERLKQLNVEILPYPTVDHKQITRRDLGRKKPFTTSGKGYRDTLTWECILELAQNEDKIIFITDNHKDFGNPLHPDLIADLNGAGLPATAVTVVKTVDDAIDTYIRPTLQKLDELVQTINAGGAKSTAISNWLTKEMPSLLANHPISPLKVGFSAEHYWTELKLVHFVDNLFVSDASKLQTSEVFIKGRVIMEADFKASTVFEPPDSEGNPEIFRDDNTAQVEIDFSALLDPDETSVLSASVVSLSTAEPPDPDHY